MEEEQWDVPEEKKGAAARMYGGVKGGLALFFALPFILIFLPIWFLYRWSEIRSGRPAPEAPWAIIFARPPKQGEGVAFSTKPSRVRRPYDQEAYTLPGFKKREAGWEPDSLVARPESGRIALVTGGGRRVGAAICRDLAALGYGVAVVYHHASAEAEEIVSAIREQGGEAKAFSLDLRQPDQSVSLLQEVARELGPVDLLINNASLFLPTPLQGSQWQVVDDLMKVNLQGPLMLAMASIAQMEKRGGMVINICDIWGEKPLKGHVAYSAAKAGLISATQVLAREAAPTVRVNAISPGAVLPPDERAGSSAFQSMLSRTPLAAASGPEAILQAIRYLLTAHYVTGEVLHVDGGRRLV
ncbi:MAG: SDR family NAD(P)-dependent oxidoreductase [Magnetococcales bacterium]|nr:SDR family NAD(P)-dependent oxidoreductase [Magnetococcales bacterium]